jgi:hypothetical protein
MSLLLKVASQFMEIRRTPPFIGQFPQQTLSCDPSVVYRGGNKRRLSANDNRCSGL